MSNDLETFLSSIPQHAQDYVKGRKLDEVECVIADLPGIARGKAVPAAKYARQGSFHLPDSIFYQTITGDWGEAAGAEGFIERDMIMRPDHSTTSAAPWTGDWTLQVIHDAFDRKGEPVPFAPRNVLKRVVELYQKKGWTPVVAPEMEFFLVARNIDPAKSIQPMMGRSGRPAAARQAYSMTAVDEFGPVIDDIYDFAEAQGFEIDGITQEGGAGQLEINLRAMAIPYDWQTRCFTSNASSERRRCVMIALPHSWPNRLRMNQAVRCTSIIQLLIMAQVKTSFLAHKVGKQTCFSIS